MKKRFICAAIAGCAAMIGQSAVAADLTLRGASLFDNEQDSDQICRAGE